jgi:hypothetical protein
VESRLSSNGGSGAPAVVANQKFKLSRYQIPLSLPVIFCPTAAAVARHGNKLSRTLFFNSRFRSKAVSCEP